MGLYIKIINSDKKVWLLPTTNLKTSLCLYQPSSIKGRILKALVPLLKHFVLWNPEIFEKYGVSVVDYGLKKNTEIYLKNLFDQNDTICFSIFLGTPGIHQKTTIQIQKGNHILGYCKISDCYDIFDIFKREQKMLEYLNKVGVNNVPRCIACDQIADSIFSFVQSTIKTPNSIIHHEFGELEKNFLGSLYEKTSVTLSYKETDFYHSVIQLLNNIDVLRLNGYDIRCVIDGINLINDYYTSITTYAVCHRDFTPWNMFVESNQLFVFDFEYAKYQYPYYLDAIHYFFQTGIFEKKWDAKQLWNEYQRSNIKNLFDNPMIALLSYLIDIVSLYVDREPQQLKGASRKCIDIWMNLCKKTLDALN